MKLNVATTGVDEIAKEIRKLSKANGGVKSKRLWRQVGQVVRAGSLECFKKQSSPDGTPWEPLKESTLRAKAYKRTKKHRKTLKKIKGYQSKVVTRMISKDKILMDTGKLRASITSESTDTSAKIGSRLVYARTHQEGSKKNNIPARPFLGVSESAKTTIINIIKKHIEEETDKVGG